jgi:two-component system phosphate regulon sensor histidine kinase PhoR
MMKINVRWKLTLIFSLLISFVLAALYFYFNSHLTSYLDLRIQENLKSELMLTKEFLDNELIDKLSFPESDKIADRIGRRLNVRATILSPNGSVIGDSSLDKELLSKIENHINRLEIQGAANTGFGQSKRFSTTIKKNMLYMAVPLGKQRIAGYIRLAIPLTDIHTFRSGMNKILLAAILFAAIAALSLGSIVSITISQPLKEMSALARAFSKGNFTKKAVIHSSDEMGDLAIALNGMASTIEEEISLVRSKEAKLEAILLNMFEGVMLTDRQGEIIMMNPSIRRLFFVDSPPEGKAPIQVIRNTSVQSIVSRVLREERGLISEEIAVNQPEEKIFKVNGVPITRNREIDGAILVFHDISELRRLERVRQDFVANVSHELRTPISSIKGYAETLLDGALNDKAHAREFVDIIYRDSERLAKLIEDILDLSRIESGKMSMSLLSVNVNEAIKRSISVVEGQAKAKSIAIKGEDVTSPRIAIADDTRLSQVLVNLLDNAIKYTPHNGIVSVSTQLRGDMIQVDVSDSGIGIPEEDIPRIFERFYRVDKAHSRDLGGTGLGLSIVKHIVQAHGGNVWVKSAPGAGSTFSFTVPVISK